LFKKGDRRKFFVPTFKEGAYESIHIAVNLTQKGMAELNCPTLAISMHQWNM